MLRKQQRQNMGVEEEQEEEKEDDEEGESGEQEQGTIWTQGRRGRLERELEIRKKILKKKPQTNTTERMWSYFFQMQKSLIIIGWKIYSRL